MHHLIVGAGPAAVSAAEHIRKLDRVADITMLVAEPEKPYSRMALPYYLVGNIDAAGCHLRKSDDHFRRLNIDVRSGRASAVDPSAKQVTLLDGDTVSYDRLLIATGATALKPPVPGIDLPGVHNCWSLADARHIIERADEGARVILMGAGFIGCIILEALAARKVDLTVIEMESRMVSRMTNEPMGDLIKAWCESKGITVMTSTRVESIAGADGDTPLSVTTAEGETLPADLVICATGVRSNTGFLDGSGIEIDQGIIVDDHMQTTVDHIYAAGDVAQGRDLSTDDYQVQAIQPTAVEHGKTAATNMVSGNRTPHQGTLNMNVLDTLGLITTSFGLWMGVDGGEEAELIDRERYRYLNLQFQDDVLVGASSLGMTQHVGVMRGLIQTGTPLGKWKDRLVEDPTRLMEAYLATAQSQDAHYQAA